MKKSEMKVLFESKDVVIVEKPAGFLSVPTTMGRKETRPIVGILLKEKYGQILPVHRLDFEVAGILVFARNENSHRTLQKLWESGSVTKTYKALSRSQDFSHWPDKVAGAEKNFRLETPQGSWESRIVQGKKRSFVGPHGQHSQTNYEFISEENSILSWKLSPVTGRRHQLRLEMSRHGFPVIADQLYGGAMPKGIVTDEIALVASELHFHKVDRIELPEKVILDWNWNLWQSRFAL